MPSLLGRFSSTSTNFFQYIADNRKKLVDRNRSMYGSTKLNSRVSRRRNITNQMKNIINSLIVNIRSACPIETGNAKMNGIGYKVFNRHQAVVTVGSPSLPKNLNHSLLSSPETNDLPSVFCNENLVVIPTAVSNLYIPTSY